MLTAENKIVLESLYSLLKISEEDYDTSDILYEPFSYQILNKESTFLNNSDNKSTKLEEDIVNDNEISKLTIEENDLKNFNTLEIAIANISLEEKQDIDTSKNLLSENTTISDNNETLIRSNTTNQNESLVIVERRRKSAVNKVKKNLELFGQDNCSLGYNNYYKFDKQTEETKEKDLSFQINNKNNCIKVSKNTKNYDKFYFDFVDASYNVSKNYQDYITKSLKSMINFDKFNINKEIMDVKINLNKTYYNILKEFKDNNKKLLILDLDETLIHSIFDYNEENVSDTTSHKRIISKTTNFYDTDFEEYVNIKVNLRPKVKEFLNAIKDNFNVCLFTASVKEYADSVISILDPDNSIFKLKLYRESCIKLGRAFIKDLRIFTDFKDINDNNLSLSLENIIIVDNSIYSFVNQLSNGILINSFYDQVDDNELSNVQDYLLNYLYHSKDIKYVNDQVFKFNELLESYKVDNN